MAYADQTEASAYFGARGLSAEWGALDSSEQDALLLLASQYLDARYAGRWVGRRATQSQDRAWPRTGARDADGYKIPAGDVPDAIKNASLEAAIRLSRDVELLPDSDDGRAVTSEKVGPIAITYEVGMTDEHLPVVPIIDGMLVGLIIPRGAGVRLIR